ncbi:MAG: magnesium-translocating P-type ATPase [Bacilli bacterium]
MNIEKELIKYSKQTELEILKKLKTKRTGLNQVEANENLIEYGKNIITTNKSNNLLHRIKESLVNPMNVVLMIISVVTLFTDIILTSDKSYQTFILINIIVLVSSIISFVQQEKSNNASKKLISLITNKIDVIRNNKEKSINIDDAVPGDIIKLRSGDMIPGDVRFIDTKDLFIDQSTLTGESNPVEKYSNSTGEDSINELRNIGFMGTNVISGSALAVILKTGNNTYFGSLAKTINNKNEKNSFEKGIENISNLLIKMMLIMVPIIFIANFITKNNFLESLLFGITIAVGLIPEMLPVIVTSTLAKGAVKMSKKKTIVKKLSAIQTFGEMDILCTDKTGTLTEDLIVVERYLNLLGEEDLKVLKHSYLNSYFQTGLKSPIDEAIIKRGTSKGLNILKEEYTRIDEIPFDFERRRMSVVLKDKNNKTQMITKGAVEEILSICTSVLIDGKSLKITENHKNNAMKLYEDLSKQGLRMIAISEKNTDLEPGMVSSKDETDMILIGFVGFLDPPKESSKEALEFLNSYGIRTVILTGDNKEVTTNVCNKLGIKTEVIMSGENISKLTDKQLKNKIEECSIFCKLSPLEKERIVKLLKQNGHTVGYMGDGINDAPSLKQADIGISVDSAVDIAKETADIILLEKDLNVLKDGVIEGRITFSNIIKYLKMATSGNFGNMFSVMIASIFLPFLPLLPIHILIQNILCDFGQLGIPFDKVEEEYIVKPKKWDTESLKKFMILFGLLSTILDIACIIILWFVFKYNTIDKAVFFQTGWFMFGIISQTLIIHFIRTHKMPFKNLASKELLLSSSIVIIITLIIGFTNIAGLFDLTRLPLSYLGWLIIIVVSYIVVIQIAKKIYIKVNKGWI